MRCKFLTPDGDLYEVDGTPPPLGAIVYLEPDLCNYQVDRIYYRVAPDPNTFLHQHYTAHITLVRP